MKKAIMVFSAAALLLFSFCLVVPLEVLAQEKELPPGISKKDNIPGQGLHKGWEQGQHKGWDKEAPKDAREIEKDKKKIREQAQEIKKRREEARKKEAKDMKTREQIPEEAIKAGDKEQANRQRQDLIGTRAVGRSNVHPRRNK